jgi:hypothetical protein
MVDRKDGFVRSLLAIAVGLLILISCCASSQALRDKSSTSPSSQPIAANLTEDYKDQGIDTDGDGLYDFLAIDVGIDVLKSGEYTLSGYLFDSQNSEVAWTIDHRILPAGRNQMRLEFDGRNIQQHGSSGNFTLRNLLLSLGNSDTGMVICDQLQSAFITKAYNFSKFAVYHPMEKTISGSGRGEILLTVYIKRILPVVLGKYSLDIAGIHIPPIYSPFSINGSKYGYAYNIEGTYLPNKPNNFTVAASGVENLNIGLKKLQGSYENSSTVWKSKQTRIWISHQSEADDHGQAKTTSDLISPGIYDAMIFGEAARNATHIELTMSLVKKVIINGKFHLSINTTGFPAGNYSINARALNGTFQLDEITVGDLAITS